MSSTVGLQGSATLLRIDLEKQSRCNPQIFEGVCTRPQAAAVEPMQVINRTVVRSRVLEKAGSPQVVVTNSPFSRLQLKVLLQSLCQAPKFETFRRLCCEHCHLCNMSQGIDILTVPRYFGCVILEKRAANFGRDPSHLDPDAHLETSTSL